jgi:hypothetical protein
LEKDQRGFFFFFTSSLLLFFISSPLHFFFSDGGVAYGFPHWVCSLLPLLLSGIIVICVHAMAGLYFIKSANLFEELILAPT